MYKNGIVVLALFKDSFDVLGGIADPLGNQLSSINYLNIKKKGEER